MQGPAFIRSGGACHITQEDEIVKSPTERSLMMRLRKCDVCFVFTLLQLWLRQVVDDDMLKHLEAHPCERMWAICTVTIPVTFRIEPQGFAVGFPVSIQMVQPS